MYDNLKSLGITNPDEIDRYSLRQEANNDILKIYFQKDKGEFFAKSVKFKYPRQRKPSSPTASARATKRSRRSAPICATLSTSWIRSASAIALKSISSVKSSTIYAIWKAWSPIRSAKSKPIWKSSPVSKSIPAARCLAGLVVSIHSRQHASSRPGMARRCPAFLPPRLSVVRPAAARYTAAACRQSYRDPGRSAPRYGSTGTPAYCDE